MKLTRGTVEPQVSKEAAPFQAASFNRYGYVLPTLRWMSSYSHVNIRIHIHISRPPLILPASPLSTSAKRTRKSL